MRSLSAQAISINGGEGSSVLCQNFEMRTWYLRWEHAAQMYDFKSSKIIERYSMYVVKKSSRYLFSWAIALHDIVYNFISFFFFLQNSYSILSIDFTDILPVTRIRLLLNNMSKNPLYNVNHCSSILSYFTQGTYILANWMVFDGLSTVAKG